MKTPINSSGQDYQAKWGLPEWVVSITVYFVISGTTAWLFYDSFKAMIAFSPFFPIYIRTLRAYGKKKRSEELTDEFVRSLLSVSTSLAAGISPENAFKTAEEDMEKLYGKRSPIVTELNKINSRVKTGNRLESAIYDMAKRNKIREIYDFATVFAVAKEKGADFTTVISSCVQIMENRREAEKEARVMIRAKQYEQRVMCMIPPGILGYLRFSSGSFIGILYHNITGIVIMTGCLAVYVLAIYIAEKIGDIRV